MVCAVHIFSEVVANPASDFKYKLDSDGNGVSITQYIGKNTKVVIPASIEDMPVVDFRFAWNENITSVVIPDTITVIIDSAFELCSNLVSVTLPSSLEEIGKNAFNGCTRLTSINLPETLKIIGEGAFQNCGFKTIILPESVKEIHGGTFSGCHELTSVTIKSKEIKFDNDYGSGLISAFSGCSKLLLKAQKKLRDLGYQGLF